MFHLLSQQIRRFASKRYCVPGKIILSCRSRACIFLTCDLQLIPRKVTTTASPKQLSTFCAFGYICIFYVFMWFLYYYLCFAFLRREIILTFNYYMPLISHEMFFFQLNLPKFQDTFTCTNNVIFTSSWDAW